MVASSWWCFGGRNEVSRQQRHFKHVQLCENGPAAEHKRSATITARHLQTHVLAPTAGLSPERPWNVQRGERLAGQTGLAGAGTPTCCLPACKHMSLASLGAATASEGVFSSVYEPQGQMECRSMLVPALKGQVCSFSPEMMSMRVDQWLCQHRQGLPLATTAPLQLQRNGPCWLSGLPARGQALS